MKLRLAQALGLLALCIVVFVVGVALVFPPPVVGGVLILLGAAGAVAVLIGVEV